MGCSSSGSARATHGVLPVQSSTACAELSRSLNGAVSSNAKVKTEEGHELCSESTRNGSKASSVFDYIDEDGVHRAFWVEDGQLMLSSDRGKPLALKRFVWCFRFDGHSKSYVHHQDGRVAPIKPDQFAKLKPLVVGAKLNCQEACGEPYEMRPETFRYGDQFTFRPADKESAAGEYMHFAIGADIKVEYVHADCIAPDHCYVNFSSVGCEVRWTDIEFFVHTGSVEAVTVKDQRSVKLLRKWGGQKVDIRLEDFREDVKDPMAALRRAVAPRLGHVDERAWVACVFEDAEGRPCDTWRAICIAGSNGDIFADTNEERLASLDSPLVIDFSDKEIEVELSQRDLLILDLRKKVASQMQVTYEAVALHHPSGLDNYLADSEMIYDIFAHGSIVASDETFLTV